MSKRNTLRRRVLLSPFVIAGIETALLSVAGRLRLSTEHLADFSLLFARPWAWLLTPWAGLLDWESVLNTNWRRVLALYIVLLWLPAASYSAAIWVVLHTVDYATATHARHGPPHPA